MASFSVQEVVKRANHLIYTATHSGRKAGIAFGEYVANVLVGDVTILMPDDMKMVPLRLWFINDEDCISFLDVAEKIGQMSRLTGQAIEKNCGTYSYTERNVSILVHIYVSAEFPTVSVDVQRVMAFYTSDDFQYRWPEIYCTPLMVRANQGDISETDQIREEAEMKKLREKIQKRHATIEPAYFTSICTFKFLFRYDYLDTLIRLMHLDWEITDPHGRSFNDIYLQAYEKTNGSTQTHEFHDLMIDMLRFRPIDPTVTIPIITPTPTTDPTPNPVPETLIPNPTAVTDDAPYDTPEQKSDSPLQINEPASSSDRSQDVVYHYRKTAELLAAMPVEARAIILNFLQSQYGKL